jgi:hypothetical protein
VGLVSESLSAWHGKCIGNNLFGGVVRMKRKNFSERIIMLLIVLFFAIPVCALALTESVTVWPRCSSSFIYNLVFR